jgi:hypothetical protein
MKRKELILYADELQVGDKIKPWVRSPNWLKVKKIQKCLFNVPAHPSDNTFDSPQVITWYSKKKFNVHGKLSEMKVLRKR